MLLWGAFSEMGIRGCSLLAAPGTLPLLCCGAWFRCVGQDLEKSPELFVSTAWAGVISVSVGKTHLDFIDAQNGLA